MHTPLPPDAQLQLTALPPSHSRNRKRGGFSLIEVTLAIAIVAFAFIALIGLLPAGMSVFNQTQDATNEMRISRDITSMILASDYESLTSALAKNVYYYDIDGSLLDTEEKPNEAYAEERIYSAKVIFDEQYLQPQQIKFDRIKQALRAVILIGKHNPSVNTRLKAIQDAAGVEELLEDPIPGHKVRVFPIVVTKTDGIARTP